MTSLLTSSRQVDTESGYFIPLANIVGRVFAYNPASGVPNFSTATWAGGRVNGDYTNGTAKYASSISTVGAGLLRDLGKTVVSSSRSFRKVQLVVSSYSTFGVGGASSTPWVEDYLTGYVELGFGNGSNGLFTPLAKYGR